LFERDVRIDVVQRSEIPKILLKFVIVIIRIFLIVVNCLASPRAKTFSLV